MAHGQINYRPQSFPLAKQDSVKMAQVFFSLVAFQQLFQVYVYVGTDFEHAVVLICDKM